MRKASQEITDPAVLEEILSVQQICRVAMNGGERPYLLPFNYGYRDHCLYIHSATEGKKIDLLREHPLVSFEVEHEVEIVPGKRACGWSTRYRSVVGEGTVQIVTDQKGKREGLRVIMAQHGYRAVQDPNNHRSGDPDSHVRRELVDRGPGESPERGPGEFDDRELEKMVILRIRITSLSGKQSSNWKVASS